MPTGISFASRDARVRDADAAVRRPAGDELGLVRAVDADDAAARPVASACPSRPRCRTPTARRPGCRRGSRAARGSRSARPASPCRPCRRRRATSRSSLPFLRSVARSLPRSIVSCVRIVLRFESCSSRTQPVRAVGPAGDADLEPRLVVVVEPRLQHEVDLGQPVLGVPAQLADRLRARRRLRADRAEQVRVRPARDRRLVRQPLVAERASCRPSRAAAGFGRGGRGRERGGQQGRGGGARSRRAMCRV